MKSVFQFNRIIYILFTLIGLYYALIAKNFGQAPIYLGLALAFDPFNQNTPWKERPFYQKLIPVMQTALAAALFGFEVATNK